MKAKRRPLWKFIVGIFILCFCLEGSAIIFTPKIANYFGIAWPGGLPDHISYAGKMYTHPTACLPDSQAKQNALTQVGSLPTLFGTAHPLLLTSVQLHSKDPATELYVETETGCYIHYELTRNS